MIVASINLCAIEIGASYERTRYFWFFTMVCWASVDIYWALSAPRTTPVVPAKSNYTSAWGTLIVYASYCLPLSSVPILGQRFLPQGDALEWMGAVTCALGVGFAIWARYCLAENWNAPVTLRDKHRLVRHGPYAIVRHPIYLGFITAVVGMALVLGEIRVFVLFQGVTILLKKMSEEEEILHAKFPAEYPAYELRVKKLVPWIW